MTLLADEASAHAWLVAQPWADDTAMARLARLAALLAEENARQNLVAASSLAEVWRRHIADSAQLLRHVPHATLCQTAGAAGPWLDLGTGAGFPGLVIAALLPAHPVVMIESRPLRGDWLMRASAEMGLGNTQVIISRLEWVPSFAAGVISARAFAPLGRLLALSARFSTGTTRWLLPKGRNAAQELQALRGWQHLFHVEHSLTAGESGIIVGALAGPAMPICPSAIEQSAEKQRVKY